MNLTRRPTNRPQEGPKRFPDWVHGAAEVGFGGTRPKGLRHGPGRVLSGIERRFADLKKRPSFFGPRRFGHAFVEMLAVDVADARNQDAVSGPGGGDRGVLATRVWTPRTM
ncbi:MAG: hypothetical protein ABSE63_04805 [Thermoguttaceae bacterium]|jgi:hypothetical protein